MQIEEGVYVHTSNYRNTHGKNPSGRGSWAFGHTNAPAPEHVFWHHGLFSDAKKAAVKHAKQRGHSEIHVLTESNEGANMREEFVPIADVITLVANDQHAEASQIVNDLLSARVLDSLQAHKQEIAQSLFAPSADSLSEEVEELDEIGPDQGKIEKAYQTQNKKIQNSVRTASTDYRTIKARKPVNEEIVQEEHESVEDFVKRGGKIKQVAPANAHGSQKPQTIKKAKQYFVKKG